MDDFAVDLDISVAWQIVTKSGGGIKRNGCAAYGNAGIKSEGCAVARSIEESCIEAVIGFIVRRNASVLDAVSDVHCASGRNLIINTGCGDCRWNIYYI